MNKMEDIIRITERHQMLVPKFNWSDKSPIMVLLDPGHGGIVNGVYTTAPNKMSTFPDFEFYEGVWNRAIVTMFAYLLHSVGGSYYVLVPENTDVPLQERVKRAITVATKTKTNVPYKFYYHSVHANAFGLESANGVEVWTSPGQTKSDVLATIYYQKLAKLGWNMRPDMGDGDPDKESDFYVLKKTPMPALLTETGFYTNRDQALKMMDTNTIHRITELMLEAHFEIIKLNLL